MTKIPLLIHGIIVGALAWLGAGLKFQPLNVHMHNLIVAKINSVPVPTEVTFDWTKVLTANAGVLALAAFSGVMLGGVALSFFWKSFGPWKLLDECRQECRQHNSAREKAEEKAHQERSRMMSEIADYKARYEILAEAVKASGLGLQLSKKDS